MNNQASAAAKVILLGEHAVVYGMPAIALPLSLIRTYADYYQGDQALTVKSESGSSLLFRWSQKGRDRDDPVAAMIYLTAQYFDVSAMQGNIVIRSDIPIASGLGSGAALSAALGRAVAAIQHRLLPNSALNELVYEVEKLHHGTPSGIDNTVVVYERPVYYVKDKALDFMEVAESFHLMVADTGIAALTRETVADVRNRYLNQPRQTGKLLESIGTLTELARKYLEAGQRIELGALMTRNHELLQNLGVSSPPLDRLVEASLAGGAYGAKLSGGGRGGNVIALVDDDVGPAVEAALLEAGARRVISSSVYGKPVDE